MSRAAHHNGTAASTGDRGARMPAGQFSREFRLASGESPYSYLMTRRIERAMALLTTPVRNREAPVTRPRLA